MTCRSLLLKGRLIRVTSRHLAVMGNVQFPPTCRPTFRRSQYLITNRRILLRANWTYPKLGDLRRGRLPTFPRLLSGLAWGCHIALRSLLCYHQR